MSNTSNADVKLYGLLLAGEFAACYRLIEESAMAPTVADRVGVARLIAAEMAHFEELSAELTAIGGDPDAALIAHAKVFDDYHRVTTPSTWTEALVKMYIGDGLAADFYSELADRMPEDVKTVMASTMGSTGSSQFAVDRVRAAVVAEPALRSRLALWGRRLLGEAITHMQWVLADEEQVMDLLFAGDGTLATAASFFDGVAARHAERMGDLGLA